MGPSRKLHTASANSGVQDERALAAMKELKTAIVVKPHKKRKDLSGTGKCIKPEMVEVARCRAASRAVFTHST